MGIIRDFLSKSIDVYREEIQPLRYDLMKAGILTPDKNAYDLKSSLVDPWAYGQTNQGYKEKYAIIDYQKCRQITYADPIVASIIQTRLNQIAAFGKPQTDKYKVGFKIALRDKERTPSKAEKARAKEIEQFIQNCGVPENFEDTPDLRRRDSFDMFLRKIARDSLTFDQANFEIVPRNDGKPYAFYAVDGATVRIIPDKKEHFERSSGDYNPTGVYVNDFGTSKEFNEFNAKHPKFAQVISGVIRHTYDEWEMAFGVRNPRTDILAYGYGYSEIEMLVTTITSHMNAETYNRKFFSQGSTIKGVIAFEGNVPPDQLEAFRRQWYQQVTGVNNAWRTPIMSMGKDSKMNWQSLHSTNREMEFGKWLEYCIKTICGVFQIDPIEIGFDISKQGSGQSGGSAGLGNGNQAERLNFSKDKGLSPLLCFLASLINDYLVYRLDPNFEFEFVGLNNASEKDDLDRALQQVKSFKTINEIRAEHDMKPLPSFEEIKNPGDVVLDSSLLNFIQAQMAQAQQEEMGGEMGPDGMPMGDQMGDQMGGQEGAEGGQEEPDYESMSLEELEAELARLEGMAKSASKKSVADLKKRLELEL
jgi:hypothetical protein